MVCVCCVHVCVCVFMMCVDGPTTKESLYTTYGEKSKLLEIMFHVSTLLRHDENDPQQLDKKRHIGNDVVVVIFKESSGPEDTVDLSSFRSQFNHVFIVVTPIVPQAILQAQSPRPGYSASTSSLPSIPKLLTKYAVYVGCKSAVKPFPPYFPERGNVFDVDNDFRNWLLKKSKKKKRCVCIRFVLMTFLFVCLFVFYIIVINGERSAVESPEFKTSKDVARKNMLIAVIEELEK